MRTTPMLLFVLAIVFGGMAFLVFDGDGLVAGLRDDQFARLVHLGAWGLVLSTTLVLMARARPGHFLKNAAIWAAAFLVLIGLYAFSAEFSMVRDRIQAALIPGSVVSSGTDGQVMVMRGDDEHFRVDASVNGVTVPFLVDTGASVVALDLATAERIGLDVSRLRYTGRVRTANGIANAAPVTISELRIGAIERRNIQAVVIEGDGIGVDLLGMSFLGRLSSVDFRGDRLVLTD